MSRDSSDWESSKGLAKAILHDRGMRRKWMARWLFFTLMWLAFGLWIIDGWLEESALRFAGWWIFCTFLAIILVIFALYDSLSVVREERDKR
ncbi:hypothetical protein [Luteolibacter sp. AS25]|uniref:hypothetical protein n=1 Tax=Luteolibacter sp. AS25 TaxID=3135776 RepID=UPI00398ADB8B